jgi:hypothetical protein
MVPHESTHESPSAVMPESRRWPQYSLRTLLLGMAVMSVIMGLGAAFGLRWSVIAGWFAAMIAIHMAANAWGTRSAARKRDPAEDVPRGVYRRGDTTVATALPAPRLGRSRWPGWGMVVASGLGASLGALAGAWLLWSPRAGWNVWVGYGLGVSSAAVVGGFLAYLASSFLAISLGAWSEASQSLPEPENEVLPPRT